MIAKFLLGLILLFQCSCVSAWMAGGTGLNVHKLDGKQRSAVHAKLGKPRETRTSVAADVRRKRSDSGTETKLIDVFDYRGKVNSRDEGSGQAIANAVTLGTIEVISIPMTAADIAVRSFGNHEIFVFYNKEEKVIESVVK